MRDYKIGDKIIWIDEPYSKHLKFYDKISIYNKIGTIINIDHKNYPPYLIEFKQYVNTKPNKKNKGKEGYCYWSPEFRIKTINLLVWWFKQILIFILNLRFKINDTVIFTNKKISKEWEKTIKVSLYQKIGKIVSIDNNDPFQPYLIEFKIRKKKKKELVILWCYKEYIYKFN